jgi:hypothetical protein
MIGGKSAAAVAALALLAPAAACRRAPALAFEVGVSTDHPERAAVTVRIEGAPRDGLILRGFATREVLRVTDLQARGADGATIGVEAGVETVTVNDRPLDIPRFTLRGPLPSDLTVSYAAAPGSREGDSHLGFTGRCEGYLGPGFGFATGRELFLLPQPAEGLRSISVRFRLPPGWNASVPWDGGDGMYRPGVEGQLAAEHLESAAIGLGSFRERSFAIGATTYRLAFQSGITSAEEEQVAGRIEAATRYVRGLFGKDLGPEYRVVILPRAPTGDEIAGEGWATGQGRTLAPLTGNRLHQYALDLIEAYVRHAPYRSEIGRPEEYWLVDGVKNLYSWKAVAAAGLIPEEEVTRGLAVGYLTSLGVRGIERDLEKLYAAGGSRRTEREVLAPMTLAVIDRTLRSAPGGGEGLDPVLARLFSGPRARSLWADLGGRPPGGWDDFRARYVTGKAILPVDAFYDLKPTSTAPEPPAGKPVRRLTIAFTGKTHGYLENCGCKVNQSGGVARRATVLEQLRRQDPGLLLIDAGDAFIMPDKQAELDYLSRQEEDLYLRTLDFMKYQAAAIGISELAFGAGAFRQATRGRGVPFLAANIREDGRPLGPASIRIATGGLRVAVIGVFEPPRGRAADPIFEDHTAFLTFEDPVAALKREVASARAGADLVLAIGRLTPETIRALASGCPGLDAVVSTEYAAAVRMGEKGEVHPEDHSGFVGRLLVAYTSLTNYGLQTVKIGLDPQNRIATAAFEDRWLKEDVPDEPRVRGMLDRFYDRVGKEAAAQESVRPPFADDRERRDGVYAGAAKCATCHAEEYAQWRRTKHGTAFKTLLDRHRHFQPKCVSCHVVAYGAPHGYRLGMAGETLANVQCEVCHGPGATHAREPAKTNIHRQVPEGVCLQCHTPDHSDHFVYAEKLPKVKHDFYD